MSRRLYKNPQVFFYLDGNSVVAYDSYQQRQFKLEPVYFDRLKFWSAGGEGEITSIDQELLSGNLLVTEPESTTQWDGDPLSLFFHSGTRNSPENSPPRSIEEICEEYCLFSDSKESPPPRYTPSFLEMIPLPRPDTSPLERFSLWQALKQRMTCRNFNKKPISLEQLSHILYASVGYIHGNQWQDLEEKGLATLGERKSSPSATGLQAFDAYVAVLRTEGLKDGFYYYSPQEHSLGLIRQGFSDENLSHLMYDQFWTSGMACGIILAADLRRLWMKDIKPRGYAMVYAEAGHISQTILLTATALGLQTWLTGSFRDKDLSECLGITNEYIIPMFFNGFGHGNTSGVPEKILKFLSD